VPPADSPSTDARRGLRVRAVLRRALAREHPAILAAHFATMLEEMPVGLLLLDHELRPLWYNGEAAYACSVWNHGERKAAALNPIRNFRVPAPLLRACADIKSKWVSSHARDARARRAVLSEFPLGLHARILPRGAQGDPPRPPSFEIHLDYRRPRGDRSRPISAGAVALLARLTPREREVAMAIREGLRTNRIAAQLRRSPLTIKSQLKSIYAKLGAQSRAEVAAQLNR
jgi:DNA-binding NarL/FixJ family response regulator